MARGFDGLGTDKLQTSGSIAALDAQSKLTVYIRGRASNLAGGNRWLIAKRGGTATNSWDLQSTGGGIPGNAGLLFIVGNAGASFGATSAAVLTAVTWFSSVVVFDGTGALNADRLKIYVDGINATLAFTGTIAASIGSNSEPITIARSNDVGDSHWNGDLAEAACWGGEALNANEALSLARGCSPLDIRRGSLSEYWPITGLHSPEPSYGTGRNGAAVTGTIFATNPPVMPRFVKLVRGSEAVPAIPIMGRSRVVTPIGRRF